jgi:hypothetical protein
MVVRGYPGRGRAAQATAPLAVEPGGHMKKDACYAPILVGFTEGLLSTGVDTDGTADAQKVDVASHDEKRIHRHVLDDTSRRGDVQRRSHSLDTKR